MFSESNRKGIMLYLIAVPSLYSPTGFNLAPFKPMLITTCVQQNYPQVIHAVTSTQQALARAFKAININYMDIAISLISKHLKATRKSGHWNAAATGLLSVKPAAHLHVARGCLSCHNSLRSGYSRKSKHLPIQQLFLLM